MSYHLIIEQQLGSMIRVTGHILTSTGSSEYQITCVHSCNWYHLTRIVQGPFFDTGWGSVPDKISEMI
jgi:hypothetical protein